MNNFKRHSFICICLCLLVSDYCFSQVKTTADITDITKVSFLLPGISYEKRIGKFQSLYGQAFIHTSFSFSYSSSLGTTSSISFEPALTLQYRYYYNFNKRTEKGKQTAMNSLNYVSPTILTILAEDVISEGYNAETRRRPINAVGLVWGLQRNYTKRFSVDFNLGFGYLFTTDTYIDETGQQVKDNVSQFSPLIHFNLGFWLNKRK